MKTERIDDGGDRGPLLLTAGAVARLLQVSVRTIRRLVLEGRLIAPVKLGGCVRWRADEVREWIDNGCPRMAEWQKQKGMS